VQTINIYGDHATCCANHGDLIIRHNAMRNLVNSIATDGILSPVMEKKGILGVTSGRRPGDVSIPDWSGSGPLAIDVAITSPLIKSNVRLTNPCEEYALSKKHGKYDASFEGSNYSFCAMVFETFGALNSEGEEVLRQMFRFAAKHLGKEFTSYCSRAWARVSCTLQKSVGQAILNRIDGNKESVVVEPVGGLSGESKEVAGAEEVPFLPLVPPQIPRYVKSSPGTKSSPVREVALKGPSVGGSARKGGVSVVAAVAVASSSSGSSRSISPQKINIVRVVGHGGNINGVEKHSEKYIPSLPVVVVAASSSSSSSCSSTLKENLNHSSSSSYSCSSSTPHYTNTIHHEKPQHNAGIPAARPTPHSS
jgi:hypothetical protein